MRRPLLLCSLLWFLPGCLTRSDDRQPRHSKALEASIQTKATAKYHTERAIDTSGMGSIRLDGAPAVPAELKARLGQYLNTRRASLAGISDDGRTLLVRTRFGETTQLHQVTRPWGARKQLTFGTEPVRGAAFVPGSKGHLLYRSDIGGDERYQFYRLDLSDGRSRLVTDGKSRHGGFLWSRRGDRIAFTNNSRNGKDFDLYLGDGRSSDAERVLECDGLWYPLDWSWDDTQLLLGEYRSINDVRLHLLEISTRQLTQLSPLEPTARYDSALFSPTGEAIYLTSDREGEFVELFAYQLSEGSWTPLSRQIPWNVEDIALSPDGGTLAFTSNENGYSVLRFLDTRSKTHRRAAGMPQGVIRGLTYARRARVLGFSLSTATQSSDVYTYDFRRSKALRWTESEMGGLPREALISPTLIHFPTFDGRVLPAFYYRPAGKGPFPVLIRIHGGPEGQARPYFSALSQYLLAESGVAVLVPNVRGSDGYGKSYLKLDNGLRREDSVRDIGALLDWLRSQDELDSGRVGVHGGSYGGYMVLACLARYPDRIKAGCDVVGISNFVTFLENTSEYRRDLRRAEYGDERDPKMRAFLNQISPSLHAERIRSALFVAQGANDPRVPASEAEQIVEAVRRAGQDVWYLLAENEGHGFRKKGNRDVFTSLAVLFFEKQLLGR